MRRHRFSVRELHTVHTAALGNRAQLNRVTLHFCHRYLSCNHALTLRLLHSLNAPAASVQITHDVTHVLFRHGNRDIHDGLEQYGPSSQKSLLEDLAAGDLEGNVFRVDRVHLAVIHFASYVDDGIAGQRTALKPGPDALFNGGEEAARDGPTEDTARIELETCASLQRLDFHVHFAELSGTPRLLLVAVIVSCTAGDGFVVRHLRHRGRQAQSELALHPPDGQIQVDFAHA